MGTLEPCEKLDIASLTYEELAAWMKGLGEPAYRAGQLFGWIHEKQAAAFSEMTNLPKALLARLSEEAFLPGFFVEKKLVSRLDGTVKYLFRLRDGEFVETVLMQYRHGLSACVSTQVGCKMGCAFCASTKAGFVRNLAPSEMLEQIYAAQREEPGRRIASVVLMGIGEPLDNFDNVVKFLTILSEERGNRLSLRHVSLSTCGLTDRIGELEKLRLGLTLSVSLHAPNDAIRSRTMPVTRKYPMEALLAACRRYAAATGRRVSFEYALIAGENDSPEYGDELGRRLTGLGGAGWCHVNLIPVNEIKEAKFRRSGRQEAELFQARLEAKGISTTIRRTLGADIAAACGQLRRENGKTAEGQ